MAVWNVVQKKIAALKKKLGHYSWDLAFTDYSEDIFYKTDKLRNYHVVKNPYKNKWFADPFILDVDDKEIKLLVEEFDYAVNRGRIAKLTIDRKTWTITNCKIVLDLPTHLSFPAIYRYNDKVYVHPENSASGRSIIYQYNEKTDELMQFQIVSEDPLTDAVFYQYEENIYLLTTKLPTPNGSTLKVYNVSQDLHTKPLTNIRFEKNYARMAGCVLRTSDSDIRPAQNCDGGYGKEVIFQEIIFEKGRLKFIDIGKLLPPNKLYHGLHTFNTYDKRLAVIDLKRYDNPRMYGFLQYLKGE